MSYDGTNFYGWQKQPYHITVQQKVEEALSTIHKSPSLIYGSGRTDTGVHAKGQVIHFDTSLNLQEEEWIKAFNRLLPKSVRFWKIEKVPCDFHARFQATSRLYHYYFKEEKYIFPWQAPYCFGLYSHIRKEEKLKEMVETLKGTHDFTSFSSSRDASPSKIKTIYQASLESWQEGYLLKLEGSSFLWNQVRSTLGTLIEYDRKGRSVEDFKNLLVEPNRSKVGTTAPPHGLFLEEVFYKNLKN